jgi:hypothetical protein
MTQLGADVASPRLCSEFTDWFHPLTSRADYVEDALVYLDLHRRLKNVRVREGLPRSDAGNIQLSAPRRRSFHNAELRLTATR